MRRELHRGEFVSPEEIAKRIGCSMGSVYRYIARGEIPCVRFGRLVRVPRALFEQIVSGDSAGRDRSEPEIRRAAS